MVENVPKDGLAVWDFNIGSYQQRSQMLLV